VRWTPGIGPAAKLRKSVSGGYKPNPKHDEMKNKRRRHDPEFKARVALEALKGVKTLPEIAKEYDIHPMQVCEWKRMMVQNAASAFGAGGKGSDAEDFERERTRLHAKIGQQAVELDWLTKKSKQLGL
jgi:transposase